MEKNLDIDPSKIIICTLLFVLTTASVIMAIDLANLADYFINYVGLG